MKYQDPIPGPELSVFLGVMKALAEQGVDSFGPVLQLLLNESMKIERSEHLHAHPVAPNHIGRLYLNGEGIAKNSPEACKWYKLSDDRGDVAGHQNAEWCRTKAL